MTLKSSVVYIITSQVQTQFRFFFFPVEGFYCKRLDQLRFSGVQK